MNSDQVRLDIIVIRNKLVRGLKPLGVSDKLRQLRREIANNNGPMYRTWLMALDEAIQLLHNDDLDGAGDMLSFAHNLPLVAGDIENWDEKHFFQVHMLGFVELSDMTAIKKMIKAVAADISSMECQS